MNTQMEGTMDNPMQLTEASPLEDRSLPAEEVIHAQQDDAATEACTPGFIP